MARYVIQSQIKAVPNLETIHHPRYGTLVVEWARTPEDCEREGRINTARAMRESGQTRLLGVRRRMGSKLGLMHEWSKNGRISYTGPAWL